MGSEQVWSESGQDVQSPALSQGPRLGYSENLESNQHKKKVSEIKKDILLPVFGNPRDWVVFYTLLHSLVSNILLSFNNQYHVEIEEISKI
jgi:hypothetical protein